MSLFYSARFSQRFPVSLLALEHLTNLSNLPPEESIPRVLAECCEIFEPVEEDLIYLLDVLQEEAEKTTKEPPKQVKVTPPLARSLWTSFHKFIQQLDSSRILLWACGFDYKKAEYLYTKVDRTVANQVISDFVASLQEHNTANLEASMYGFGGKYQDEAENEYTTDATEMNAEDLRKLLSRK